MTGAGAPGGPGIIKCLKEISNSTLIVADADEKASGRYLNNFFLKIPKANSKNFVEVVLDICIKNNIQIIFPLVTNELFVFSKNKNIFLKNNIKVIVSDYESLVIANNKSLLYKHLEKYGINTPMYRVVTNYKNFFKAKEEIISKKSSIKISEIELELLAEELRSAVNSLGRITGNVDVEDLLEVIFSDFCIGK